MTPEELFNQLEFTSNHYNSFKRGRDFVYFSTGGWSENEELIYELQKQNVFRFLLVEWKAGGHYKFKIPSKDLLNYDFNKKTNEDE